MSKFQQADVCFRMAIVNDSEHAAKVQSSLHRAVFTASLACFFSLILVYWVEKPAVELLEEGWAELLAYAVVPVSVTFIMLYRSCWHREITGVARTIALLMLSCVVFLAVIFAIGVMLGVTWFCQNAVSGGFHP